MKPDRRALLRRRVAIGCAYLVVAGVFCWELFMPGHSMYRWDTAMYAWPLHVEIQRQVLSGAAPFWAPGICCGTPLLANASAGVLYPLRWLVLPLPMPWSYHLFVFLHVWLSLLGMHWMCRRLLRVGTAAAVVAALAYGFSGYMHSMWDTHNFYALPWIPMLFASLGGRRMSVVGVTLSMAMLIVAGDVQAAALSVPIACVAVVALRRGQRRDMLAGFAALALGVLLAAPQWLPMLHVMVGSERSGGLSSAVAMTRSFPPLRLIELFIPYAIGDRHVWFGDALMTQGVTVKPPWVCSLHIGALAALLAGGALWRHRRGVTVGFALLGGVALLLAFGAFLPGFGTWLRLPLVGGFRYPEKYLLWATFSLAALAGIGSRHMTALVRGGRRGVILRWILAWLAGGALAVGVACFVLAGTEGFVGWLLPRWCFAVLPVACCTMAAIWVRPWRQRFPRCLVMLVAAEMACLWLSRPATSRDFDPLLPPESASVMLAAGYQGSESGRFFRDPAAIVFASRARLQDADAPETHAVMYHAAMVWNTPLFWDIHSADGFSPLESASMQEFRLRYGNADNVKIPAVSDLAKYLKESAVTWLVTTPQRAGELAAHGVTVEGILPLGGGRSCLCRLMPRPMAELRPTSGGEPDVALLCMRSAPGALVVGPFGGRGGTVLVRESYAPGWRGTTDTGERIAVRSRLPWGMLEFDVPPGTEGVLLSYVPEGWWVGVALAVVAALAGTWWLRAGISR